MTSHRLLPYERWLADAVVRRQERAGSHSQDAWHWSHGPEGARLLHASIADMIVGYVIVLAGVGVWSAFGQMPAPGFGAGLGTDCLLGIFAACMALSMTRQVQANGARKAYGREQSLAKPAPEPPVTPPRPRRAVLPRRRSPEP